MKSGIIFSIILIFLNISLSNAQTPQAITLQGNPEAGQEVQILMSSPENAGNTYILALSFSTAGIPTEFGTIPLGYDALLEASLNPQQNFLSTMLFNNIGVLNSSGNAIATLSTPSLQLQNNFTIYAAYVTIVFNPFNITYISPALQITITPDTTPPEIAVVSPQNQTYNFTNTPASIDYAISSNEVLSSANYTIANSSGSAIDSGQLLFNSTNNYWSSPASSHPHLSRGQHQITFTTADLAGNPASVGPIYFTIFREIGVSTCQQGSANYLNGTWDRVYLTDNIDLSQAGDCMVFGGDNVIFDGNGHRIKGVGLNGYGIRTDPYDNLVVQNVEIKEFEIGILAQANSNNVTIQNNSIKYNIDGIIWQNGNGFRILNNVFYTNNQHGIQPILTSNNLIEGNTFSFNQYALEAAVMTNSLIKNNRIEGNNGFLLFGSDNDNLIYHNLFLYTVSPIDGGTNSWDNGMWNPVTNPDGGGNFWNPFNGLPINQPCPDANNDGICDVPYVIGGGGGNQDNYAFVNQSGWNSP